MYIKHVKNYSSVFIGNLMMYQSEPKVRRISQVKSKEISGFEQSDSNPSYDINNKIVETSNLNKGRRKSSSSHIGSKNTPYNSNGAGTKAAISSIPSRVNPVNKADTNKSSKLPNTQTKNVKTVKTTTFG